MLGNFVLHIYAYLDPDFSKNLLYLLKHQILAF